LSFVVAVSVAIVALVAGSLCYFKKRNIKLYFLFSKTVVSKLLIAKVLSTKQASNQS
jgi:hypothetical protein